MDWADEQAGKLVPDIEDGWEVAVCRRQVAAALREERERVAKIARAIAVSNKDSSDEAARGATWAAEEIERRILDGKQA